MGFCCAQHPPHRGLHLYQRDGPGTTLLSGGAKLLKNKHAYSCNAYLLVFTSARNKAEQQKENADEPQTINQSSHRCRLFSVVGKWMALVLQGAHEWTVSL